MLCYCSPSRGRLYIFLLTLGMEIMKYTLENILYIYIYNDILYIDIYHQPPNKLHKYIVKYVSRHSPFVRGCAPKRTLLCIYEVY